MNIDWTEQRTKPEKHQSARVQRISLPTRLLRMTPSPERKWAGQSEPRVAVCKASRMGSCIKPNQLI
jgi:hypothetical protein